MRFTAIPTSEKILLHKKAENFQTEWHIFQIIIHTQWRIQTLALLYGRAYKSKLYNNNDDDDNNSDNKQNSLYNNGLGLKSDACVG